MILDSSRIDEEVDKAAAFAEKVRNFRSTRVKTLMKYEAAINSFAAKFSKEPIKVGNMYTTGTTNEYDEDYALLIHAELQLKTVPKNKAAETKLAKAMQAAWDDKIGSQLLTAQIYSITGAHVKTHWCHLRFTNGGAARFEIRAYKS